MTPKLSPRTTQLVEKIFAQKDIAEASQWLEEECGNNLPFCKSNNEYQMERIRFGVIKRSNGEINKMLKAIDLARRDWRDLLMASGFGYHLDAHEIWAKEILEK
jgi:hypothetical protein